MGEKMSLQNFKIFLKEQEEKQIKLIVLTRYVKEKGKVKFSETATNFLEQSKKAGMDSWAVDFFKAVAHKNGDKIIIENFDGDGGKLKLPVKDTIVVARGSAVENRAGRALFSQLQELGVSVLNTLESMDVCRDKYVTGEKLKAAGLPTPRTTLLTSIEDEDLDEAIKKIGGKFPVVMKTLNGAEGIGVSIIESRSSLKSVLQTLMSVAKCDMLLQEYMKITFDVRTLVYNGKVIASMKRTKAKKDFRTNHALGGDVIPYKLSEDEIELTQAAAKAVGCNYCGVDHIVVDGKYYLIEVNGSPGSGAEYQEYITKKGNIINGKQLIKIVVEKLKERLSWIKKSLTVGRVEMIELEGVGKVKAKIDSGNGSYNGLHATNIKVEGKEVSFTTIDGKTFTKKCVDTVNIKHRVDAIENGNESVEKRCVVEFDMVFNNEKYKKVRFTLSDRSNFLYPILIGKKFLEDVNALISTSKSFLISSEEDGNKK
jgi:ribosomal protein S6--L-glutamate ligase